MTTDDDRRWLADSSPIPRSKPRALAPLRPHTSCNFELNRTKGVEGFFCPDGCGARCGGVNSSLAAAIWADEEGTQALRRLTMRTGGLLESGAIDEVRFVRTATVRVH